MSSTTTATGDFELMLKVGSVWVKAHTGTIPRSRARRLRDMYRVERPDTPTRVRKAA